MTDPMKRLTVDASVCAGCRVCEMYCAYEHEKKFSPSLSRITVIKDEKHGMDYPVFCRQCKACTSIEACPTGALQRDMDGIVKVDIDICISCGQCAEKCKYNAVKMWEGQPIICDLCEGSPKCVEKCPTKAINYTESEVFMEYPEDAFKKLRQRWGINA